MKTDKAEFFILLAILCCSLFALSVRVYAETDDEILAKSIIKATATRDPWRIPTHLFGSPDT